MSCERTIVLTGCDGSLGRELLAVLSESDGVAYATSHAVDAKFPLDVTQYDKVLDLLNKVKPSILFHMAAIVPIPKVEENPGAALTTNVLGLRNVLHAVQTLQLQTRVIVTSSSEVYGNGQKGVRFDEMDPFSPNNFYACTKVAQEEVAGLYLKKGVDVRIARVFNYSSVFKKPIYSLESFADQLAMIGQTGSKGKISVGNLEPERDFLQGADAATALRSIALTDTPHRVFNVCSGETTRMSDLLYYLINAFGLTIEISTDARRARTLENAYVCGCNDRLRSLGWSPSFGAREIVQILADHYKRLYGLS